ncbi:hypothetical protein TREMEDRAFT_68268 [Tremella mesenterica DSM 1558]|uniref:uncharacterized protein n=1 Tax=Tremella mesenterica (strain ATCC 24925 / CBS 8224 / DSM 1558 / NBRC 9311 / NRRL Y-6157 / RJB 2259-6 / UBC 559-6) TaxID=578456 RepID=UPI0003F49663|nr:uncharacterized protein TREMEDRAFT_68268 [Tremella mesenterica DSM 1558]EIW70890.1 hypothetical protein TREMEDRAFT_68268 [Tremella mesenterica DSM 1558]
MWRPSRQSRDPLDEIQGGQRISLPTSSTPAPPVLTLRARSAPVLLRQRSGLTQGDIRPPENVQGQRVLGNGEGVFAPDSITLGQLKAHTAAMPQKQKVTWTEATAAERRSYIERQLEYLESPLDEMRGFAGWGLQYLLLGNFTETPTPELQLHWIMQNAKMIRDADGVVLLVTSLRDASKRYNACRAQLGRAAEDRHEYTEELRRLMTLLYFIVEVFRTDETFGDELMSMSPCLLLVLFDMLAGLKERPPGGYPFKKLLLLLWKTLLACLGGMNDATKAHALTRELAGLGPEIKHFTKATPIDISSFRQDTSIKYPTFSPSPSFSIPVSNERLAEGIKPLPSRPNYYSTEIPAPSKPPPESVAQPPPQPTQPMPGTPAPSPPPSPIPMKPKKQQFQTDPNKPFVFPFSRLSLNGPGSLVPYAIDEADKLYHKHAYVSLGLYQMWTEREEYIREERGLGQKGLLGLSFEDEEEDEEAEEAMRREWKYEEEEEEAKERGDKEGMRIAKEKKLASKRLHRVEVLYKGILPNMQNCVIAILKILLANVTGPGMQQVQMSLQGATSPTNEQPPQLPPPYNPSPEAIDLARSSEVVSKAISAILILLLKWFKASHCLKAHYFAQLLFDSNCLLLVLKMLPPIFTHLGEQEVELITEYSWRNFFAAINFLKVLQKMTKHRSHRTFMLNQYKVSGILKRMLRIQQPMMQLQTLKLIKSQMPWCGRKWRQSEFSHYTIYPCLILLDNMKVITSIYLNCRPDLRDDWLSGQDHESELEGALPQESALRSLVAFYNKRHYLISSIPLPSPDPAHRRSDSTSAVMLEDPALQPHKPRALSHSSNDDVFPPRKIGYDLGLLYDPDGMIDFWLHEYEDVLGEVFGGEWEEDWVADRGLGGGMVWDKLGEIMRAKGGREDEISDSESVVSVGELGEGARMGVGGIEGGLFVRREEVENKNTWEHMSPAALALLPRSPQERRRSSGANHNSPLRTVHVGGPLDNSPFDEDDDREPGPMPLNRGTKDEEDRDYKAVDEVEWVFGE